jgi:hypothetical protein
MILATIPVGLCSGLICRHRHWVPSPMPPLSEDEVQQRRAKLANENEFLVSVFSHWRRNLSGWGIAPIADLTLAARDEQRDDDHRDPPPISRRLH